MAIPTSTKAMLCRLEEVLCKGHGVVDSRIIPAAHFQNAGWQDKDRDLSAARSHSHAELTFRVRQMDPDPTRFCEQDAYYQLSILIEWRRYAGHEQRALEVLTQSSVMMDDYHMIRMALMTPTNLLTTEDGEPTGLSSGVLVDRDGRATFTPSHADRVLIGVAEFEGVIRLAFPS